MVGAMSIAPAVAIPTVYARNIFYRRNETFALGI